MTLDLELAAIIHALKMWRHYLLGRRFVFVSDHSGFRYMFDQPNLNSRKARWLGTISDYDIKIRYIKGKENVVVNALSKRPRTFSLVSLKVNLRERVLEKLFDYSWYLKVISALQSGKKIEPKF